MRILTFLASTALATVIGASAASAAQVTFTWDPSQTTPTALSTPGSGSPQFHANDIVISDFATINLANLNNVTENGTLAVTGFNGASLTRGFVNGSGQGSAGAIGGASAYQLYFTFSSTSHLVAQPDGSLKGAFDTLTYTLWGDVGGNCTFAVAGPSCGGDTQLALATGMLSTLGANSVTIGTDGTPTANVSVTILPGANAGGFFVDPSDIALFDFSAAFTNTNGAATRSGNIITINGGGGNVDLVQVPEPVTLSIFGAGLAGAAALRRRKAKKA